MVAIAVVSLGAFHSLQESRRSVKVYREPLEEIIGRAATDLRFRKKMFEDPETAFEEYNLTEKQIKALKSISTDALEKFAHQLTEIIGENPSEV